jgi:hypothetical protein
MAAQSVPDKVVVLAGDEWLGYNSYPATAGLQAPEVEGYPIGKRRWENSFVIDLSLEPDPPKPSALLKKDGGSFLWIPAPLWQRYVSLGGPSGQLGFPVGPPEGSYQDGWRQTFEHGSMASRPDSTVTATVLP